MLQEESRKLNVADRVIFLGFRSDVSEILHVVDLFCFPSLQEGLPVALMEAMAAGVPCAASKIRGNQDLIPTQQLFDPLDENRLVEMILESQRKSGFDLDKCMEFDASKVKWNMKQIYKEIN